MSSFFCIRNIGLWQKILMTATVSLTLNLSLMMLSNRLASKVRSTPNFFLAESWNSRNLLVLVSFLKYTSRVKQILPVTRFLLRKSNEIREKEACQYYGLGITILQQHFTNRSPFESGFSILICLTSIFIQLYSISVLWLHYLFWEYSTYPTLLHTKNDFQYFRIENLMLLLLS